MDGMEGILYITTVKEAVDCCRKGEECIVGQQSPNKRDRQEREGRELKRGNMFWYFFKSTATNTKRGVGCGT